MVSNEAWPMQMIFLDDDEEEDVPTEITIPSLTQEMIVDCCQENRLIAKRLSTIEEGDEQSTVATIDIELDDYWSQSSTCFACFLSDSWDVTIEIPTIFCYTFQEKSEYDKTVPSKEDRLGVVSKWLWSLLSYELV